MGFSIGYWANTKRWTQTHINKDGKPICGSQISENKRFQWCCNDLSMYSYIECSHCKKWHSKLVKNRRV